jgi:hypothetical protein
MAPTNKDSGATRIAVLHMFQAVQHPELDTLGLVAIRDFLKKRARYLRLVAQNNKADGVKVTPITVVASLDPELLENLIYMEKVDENSVDYCTDMEDRWTRQALKAVGPKAAAFPQHKKSAGEKHFLSDCPHTKKDNAIVLLSEYTRKANFKSLGKNRSTADNRDGQTRI